GADLAQAAARHAPDGAAVDEIVGDGVGLVEEPPGPARRGPATERERPARRPAELQVRERRGRRPARQRLLMEEGDRAVVARLLMRVVDGHTEPAPEAPPN